MGSVVSDLVGNKANQGSAFANIGIAQGQQALSTAQSLIDKVRGYIEQPAADKFTPLKI